MGSRATRVAQVCALLLLPLGMLGGLTACQTRLVGGRTPDYDQPRGKHSGIPFRLSRPVFVINKVIPAKEDPDQKVRYQVVVEYRSDPTAVYWLTVDPAEFHSSNLTLSFTRLAQDDLGDDPTSHGFVVGAGANGGDKSKVFLEALGTFATDAIGLYALSEGNSKAKTGFGAAFLAGGGQFKIFADRMVQQAPPGIQILGADDVQRLLGPTGRVPEEFEALLEEMRQKGRAAFTDWKQDWKGWLTSFHDLTGVDLRPLHQLFQDFPILAHLLNEALDRPQALPGQDAAVLETLKDDMRGELKGVKVKGGFTMDEHRKANVQAHLQLLLQHRFLDRLEQRTQPSDEYAAVERRMFAAADQHVAWDEKRRLEAFLESGTELYEKNSPTPPEPGFVHELKQASLRVLELDAAITSVVEAVVLRDDPAKITAPVVGPGPTWTDWEETKVEVCRPRWLYQPAVPGPTGERAVWLRDHLRRLNGGTDPTLDGDFVLLVERSYPDREVRLDGRLIGQVHEIPQVPPVKECK